MLKETDETYHQMELEDYFENTVKPDLFAVSRVFAEARKQMTLSELKMFAYALTHVKWKERCPDVLYLDKKEIASIVGITESDSSDLSQHLKRSVGNLAKHSYLEFSDKESGAWVNGFFVTSISFFKNRIRIRMNNDYLPLFGNLDKGYITMWSGDIFQMKSERSIKFYELLRENSDTRLEINTGTVGIKKFKELFDIPKDGEGSYMNSSSGHFDRFNFERRVIDPVCEDLSHTKMLQLLVQPNGKYYEKVKRGNRVIAYKFFWVLSMHPNVGTAKEVQEIQERVDKNPQVLKVAKDIIRGSKKPVKKKTSKAWDEGIEKSDIDYVAITQQIMKRDMEDNPL